MAQFLTLFTALVVGALAAPAPAAEPETRVKRACLSQAETREEIRTHRLVEPFAALKTASAQFKAEALKVRLCRVGDEFVYEISLLHRDGRYVHVVLSASTGKVIEPHRAREAAAPKN